MKHGPTEALMALLSTNSGQNILAPHDIQALVIQPLIRQSVATSVSTVVTTASHSTRFPIVVTDPTNAWTAEGEEIDVTDPELDELEVTPSKLAGLTAVSAELMADSDPSALDVVGAGLVRDLQVKLDAAYFGNTVENGPDGLESLSAPTTTLNYAEEGNLDPFAEAISLAEQVGLTPVAADGSPGAAFVGNPADVLLVSTTKTDSSDSNEPLLAVDRNVTQPTGRAILGYPLWSSPAVTEGAMWLVPKDKCFVVMRNDPSVVADSSAYFSSDRVGIRCVLRVGFGFPHEAAIVQVVIDGGS
jgi:HK97 family phage major capsid protein